MRLFIKRGKNLKEVIKKKKPQITEKKNNQIGRIVLWPYDTVGDISTARVVNEKSNKCLN